MQRTFYDYLALTVARLGPVGLSPKAPGTAASAVAALLAPWCFLPWDTAIRLLILILLFFVGAMAATKAEGLLGAKDPSSVVVDELLGQWLVFLPMSSAVAMPETTLAFFPGPTLHGTPVLLLLAGFIFFRLFDIAKPGPVRASEQWLPNGYGIMIDDVLAGLFGMLCFALVLALPHVF